MFQLLNWIPGCRGPWYIRHYNEKSSPPVIPDRRPTFPHVLPPPPRPIPESRYQRRLIDEDFPRVSRRYSYDPKYQRHPMDDEIFKVIPSPPRDATPMPRVIRRENSQRTRGSRTNSSIHTNDRSRSDAAVRRRIADETLAAIERGEVQLHGSSYRFRDVVAYLIDHTIFFAPESILAT